MVAKNSSSLKLYKNIFNLFKSSFLKLSAFSIVFLFLAFSNILFNFIFCGIYFLMFASNIFKDYINNLTLPLSISLGVSRKDLFITKSLFLICFSIVLPIVVYLIMILLGYIIDFNLFIVILFLQIGICSILNSYSSGSSIFHICSMILMICILFIFPYMVIENKISINVFICINIIFSLLNYILTGYKFLTSDIYFRRNT